jgi:hypothetical protein
MENLVPAVLRGAAQSIHYEKQEADVKQVAVQADPQQLPAVPSDEVGDTHYNLVSKRHRIRRVLHVHHPYYDHLG